MLIYSGGVLLSTLADISNFSGSEWKSKCVQLPENLDPNQGYNIKFKAIRGSAYSADIGVDNVGLVEGCPRKF